MSKKKTFKNPKSKLQEIFKDNTYLLDEPEVKELIEYCKKMYEKVFRKADELDKFMNFTLEQCMYSDVILKEGNNCTQVVKSILDYIERME